MASLTEQSLGGSSEWVLSTSGLVMDEPWSRDFAGTGLRCGGTILKVLKGSPANVLVPDTTGSPLQAIVELFHWCEVIKSWLVFYLCKLTLKRLQGDSIRYDFLQSYLTVSCHRLGPFSYCASLNELQGGELIIKLNQDSTKPLDSALRVGPISTGLASASV